MGLLTETPKRIMQKAKNAAHLHAPKHGRHLIEDATSYAILQAYEAKAKGVDLFKYDYHVQNFYRKELGQSGRSPNRDERSQYPYLQKQYETQIDPSYHLAKQRLEKLELSSRSDEAGLRALKGEDLGVDVARAAGISKAAVSQGARNVIRKVNEK